MTLFRKQAIFFFLFLALLGSGVGIGYRLLWAKPPAQATPVANCTPNRVNFDIVYVHAPRYGDNQNSQWLDTVRTIAPDPGADLRLLHPNCTEELLFPLPGHRALVDRPLGNGAVQDPNISFDGQWVVFTYYHDMSDAATNPQRCQSARCLSRYGADLYRLHLTTREVVRLTRQEFTPNSGNNADFRSCAAQTGANCPGVGVFNINPAFVAATDLAQPKIVFVSSRNNFITFGDNHSQRALQLFTMDWRGQNVEQIGYLNNFQALHPFQLVDGRLMFTTWEAQGGRDPRLFPLWFIGPDGTQWNSGSGFGEAETVHHFMTQMSDGDIVTVRYYNLNNNGFGDLARYPLPNNGGHDLFRGIDEAGTYMPFQRPGQVNLTNWTDEAYSLAGDFPAPCAVGNNIYNDIANSCPSHTRIGKVTHPAVTPGDDLLLVYTPGPANHNGSYVNEGSALPFYDSGLYLLNRTKAADGSGLPIDLQRILNHPNYNEQWPRPVVPYSALFPGRTQPVVWPEYQNRGEAEHHLAPDTPFGLIGSSSLIHRDTKPRNAGYNQNADGSNDPDPFNASHEALFAWRAQGADAGLYSDNDIYAIRLLALLPSTDRSYPNNGAGWYNIGDERIRILGEIPVRHEGVQDAQGNVDTSFLARIPADTPFTFQTLDRNGMVLNMAQTWHQVRPGEARYDCGGCHAHSKAPLDFATTVAGQPGYVPTDLALQTPLLNLIALNGNPTVTNHPVRATTVEYKRDILPILQNRCAGCHANDTADGRLNLHDDGQLLACTNQRWPGTYYRLVMDDYSNAGCRFGLGPPANSNDYFIYPQRTRYLRTYQARESLLIWKLFGARLDGRTNATRTGDIDFTPDAMHANLLGWAEKLTLARWVDLGAPINYPSPNTIGNGNAFWGWFEDDLRPTLWVGPTVSQAAAGAVNSITVAAYDLESELANNSLSVTLNVPVGGQAAGTNFAAGVNPANGATVNVPLPAAINLATSGAVLTVSLRDSAGHTTTVVRSYGAGNGTNATATPTRQPTATPTARPTNTATPLPTATPPPGVRAFPDTTNGIFVFNDQLTNNLSDAQARFIATRYVGAQKLLRDQSRRLRQVNPNFLVLHYRLGQALGHSVPNGQCQPTNQFISIIDGNNWVQEWPGDATVQPGWFFQWNGQRVFHCEWGHYLAELNDPGWRAWWSGQVIQQLQTNENDGLFGDSYSVANYLGAYNPALPVVDAAFETAWATRQRNFTDYIRGQFAGRWQWLPNVGAWITSRDPADYSNVDGVMIEGFAGWGNGNFFDAADWQLQMNRILSLARANKIIIAQCYPNATNINERMFMLGSYLLTKGTRSYLNLELGLEPEWFPEYGIDLGAPVDALPATINSYFDGTWNLYRRRYTNGLVLVNPGNSARTINLGGNYVRIIPSGGGFVSADGVAPGTLNRTTVNTVTLGPNEAAVLLNDSGSGTVNVKINFQPANAQIPAGYLVDSGQLYGNRGNGYSYGWSGNNTRMTRDRNSSRSPDQRYDTFLFMQKVGPYQWEIGVPNGAYTVRIVAGDPSQINSVYRIQVENTLVVNGTPTSNARWVEGVATVQVSDGRLTLSSANGAVNNRIAFLEISSATVAVAQNVALAEVNEEDPATATILHISAIDNQSVQLEWATGEEVDTGGFYLYRSTTGERADATLITHNPIPKKNGVGGASYILIDANVTPAVYTYWLVEQEIDPTADELAEETFEYDPVAIAIGLDGRVYLPLINK